MSDKIIKFPGARGATPVAPSEPVTTPQPSPALETTAEDADKAALIGPDGAPIYLSKDQVKAIQIITSGMPFLLIGMKPTDTGVDFYRVLEGDDSDLRNAYPHMVDQLDKAYYKKGILK